MLAITFEMLVLETISILKTHQFKLTWKLINYYAADKAKYQFFRLET